MIVTPELQPKWNSIITDVFREFIDICKEYQLTWFCGGGTAIGAVRHHGLIPWDDDIDVFMPRPDYDRLREICSNRDMGNYELTTPYEIADYPVYFMKLCSRNTTLIEEADTPCMIGLYVDIFPLDGTADDLDEAYRLKRQFRKLMNRMEAISTHNRFSEYISLLSEPKEWGRFVTKTIGFFCRPLLRKKLLQKMDAICYQYHYEQAKNVVVYSGVYDRREIYPKEWVSSAVTFQFEGMDVKLSVGYDHYLRQFFGDYMQLPPEEKRVSHHIKAYFNMDEREPFSVVMKKIGK